MKISALLGAFILFPNLPLSSSLEVRKLNADVKLARSIPPAVVLRHGTEKTFNATLSSDRNLSRSPAAATEHVHDKHKIHNITQAGVHGIYHGSNLTGKNIHEQMMSTPDGICMYALPARFNIGLLDSTFGQAVPQPMNISPVGDPPLQGMFDTMQFSLERIFYDRFVATATQTRSAQDCVMIYVPYFVAWETSAVHGVWKQTNRPAMDAEVFSYLSHWEASGVPGRHHFIVIGRISVNMAYFLKNPVFSNMVKLVLEDSMPGQYANVFAIPYPTWFRYYPDLEPTPAVPRPVINVLSAGIAMSQDTPGCNMDWLGNLPTRMQASCNGREFCSYHIIPEHDDWVVGGLYEAQDANGKWWPVTIKSKNPDGSFSVQVHDQAGSVWPVVWKVHLRRPGQSMSKVGHNSTIKCKALGVYGQYKCGTSVRSFKSVEGEVAVGHAVVIGCPKGPCWIWGTCNHRLSTSAPTSPLSRSGPLLTMIGSARPHEHERTIILRMCLERPSLCSIYDTGVRENSSLSVQNHIPDMYQMLMASTFCATCPGDTPTRKGLFDSLVLGCIPVITSEETMQHYVFHMPFWRSISVLVTADKLFSAGFNLVDHLHAYEQSHAQEVLQKQASIREYAYSLQYSSVPSNNVMRGPDAFDKTLEYMLMRPQAPANARDFPGVYSIVNVGSGRRIFARADGNNGTSFGAFAEPQATHDDQKWYIVGRGDGHCCYTFVNVASNRALYADSLNEDGIAFGARALSVDVWDAMYVDQKLKWRLHPSGASAYAIVNVMSGRRLFAHTGKAENDGLGASLDLPESPDQLWKLERLP